MVSEILECQRASASSRRLPYERLIHNDIFRLLIIIFQCEFIAGTFVDLCVTHLLSLVLRSIGPDYRY